MAEKHEPPWDMCRPGNLWMIHPVSAENDGIDYFIATICALGSAAEEREVAARIVQAVNNHAALVKALEQARKQLAAEAAAYPGMSASKYDDLVGGREEARAAIVAVLAAVKEG